MITKLSTFAYFFIVAIFVSLLACKNIGSESFTPERDLLSLHYDHAPDKDDGQSAAADRTILESVFGCDWIKRHVIPVSGTYGKNARSFNTDSNIVMDVVWNDCGGWLAGHDNREEVIDELTTRWLKCIKDGGDIWVKEGGQSDITAAVVRRINSIMPDVATTKRIHVIQHSKWNENQTTETELAYVKKNTNYIKIRDANRYLNIEGGDERFVRAASEHPVFGNAWKAAFDYFNPKDRLDFSDTGELLYILGIGEISIEEFKMRFFD